MVRYLLVIQMGAGFVTAETPDRASCDRLAATLRRDVLGMLTTPPAPHPMHGLRHLGEHLCIAVPR